MQPDPDPRNWSRSMLDQLCHLSKLTYCNLPRAQELLRAEFNRRREGGVAGAVRYKNVTQLIASDILRAVVALELGDNDESYEERDATPEVPHVPTTRARAAAMNTDVQAATGGSATASKAHPTIATPAETGNMPRKQPIQHGPEPLTSANLMAHDGTVTFSNEDQEIMDLEDELARRKTEKAECRVEEAERKVEVAKRRLEEAELKLAHARQRYGRKRARTLAATEVVDLGSEPDDEHRMDVGRNVRIRY
ncbi:hypothetical protein W97_07272 [Coniosporium apollinis CBS 100218]|uniref:Uncharacterized protein n=1 Tax=Coniosporium apollinis (strain CBS 100218) TaxID=1168221 RepID=R7Z286_CONA1|nr:uncharacterized protein W97_07272 [Coniosporium apollinis CBS 100218]EON68124.1 hypothetical protein W97_07272 [Coniosporium apollinis CBS 100218]